MAGCSQSQSLKKAPDPKLIWKEAIYILSPRLHSGGVHANSSAQLPQSRFQLVDGCK